MFPLGPELEKDHKLIFVLKIEELRWIGNFLLEHIKFTKHSRINLVRITGFSLLNSSG